MFWFLLGLGLGASTPSGPPPQLLPLPTPVTYSEVEVSRKLGGAGRAGLTCWVTYRRNDGEYRMEMHNPKDCPEYKL